MEHVFILDYVSRDMDRRERVTAERASLISLHRSLRGAQDAAVVFYDMGPIFYWKQRDNDPAVWDAVFNTSHASSPLRITKTEVAH